MMNDSKDGLKRLLQSQQNFCKLSDALSEKDSISEKDSSNENNNSQEQVQKRTVESRNAQVKIEAQRHNSQKQASKNRSNVAQVKVEALSRNDSTASTAHHSQNRSNVAQVKLEALSRNDSTATAHHHSQKQVSVNSRANCQVKLEPRTQSDSSEACNPRRQGSDTSDPLDLDRPSTSTASLMLDSQPSTSTASTEVFSPSTDANKDVDENFDADFADEPFAEEDDEASESDEVQVVAKRYKRNAASGKFQNKESPINRPRTTQLTLAAYDFTKSVIKKNGKAFMEKIPRKASCGMHKCPIKGCFMACGSRTALRQHIRFNHPKLYEVIKKTATPENFWKTRTNHPLEIVPRKKKLFTDDEYDEDELAEEKARRGQFSVIFKLFEYLPEAREAKAHLDRIIDLCGERPVGK